MTEQGGVERFTEPDRLRPNPNGGMVFYSDHLERVEELEQQIAEIRGQVDAREYERWEAVGRADALQTLLAEAIEEFEGRARLHRGSVQAEAHQGDAAYLQLRLDELQANYKKVQDLELGEERRMPEITTGYFALPAPADDDAAGWKELALRRAEEYNRLADQVEKAWAERDQLLEAVRAHRERATFSCNKCGFIGDSMLHPGCHYLASNGSVADHMLYTTAAAIERGESR